MGRIGDSIILILHQAFVSGSENMTSTLQWLNGSYTCGKVGELFTTSSFQIRLLAGDITVLENFGIQLYACACYHLAYEVHVACFKFEPIQPTTRGSGENISATRCASLSVGNGWLLLCSRLSTSQNMITTYLCVLFEYVLSQNIGTQNPMAFLLHPGRLTWNLHITHLERNMIFQTSMIMYHVNLQGCKMNHFQDDFGIPQKIHVIVWRLSTSAHSPPWPWPNGGPTLITLCYNPYKRPYKWVTEVTTPINGVITYNW